MDKKINFKKSTIYHDLETQFWLRTLAFTIDNIIIRTFIIPFLFWGLSFLFDISYIGKLTLPFTHSFSLDFKNITSISISIYLIVFIIYSSILESSKLKGTIGKWFLRFKVLDYEYKRITFVKALFRNFLKIISIFSVIGVSLIDMTKRRQGLHDIMVKTILTRKRI
ncbi:RDD family protein [Natronoflexus pectinivorans]|uniref:Putative RDD family membrane protein YckC n=1 Tax=Natronoflexus pectinivorans TaxID=682526 RepID=A0A4R2G3T6_9BACT|nr:putative RDD family membrane protein YckC [Natronoflexus pectinivorans]